MSYIDRYKAKKKTKQLKNGATVDPGSESGPPATTRATRGIRYTYSNKAAPMLVVPRKVSSLAPIPVPRLPGQEDIPSSDSGHENASITAPLGEVPQAGHIVSSYSATPPSPAGSTEIDPASQTEDEDGDGEDKDEDGEVDVEDAPEFGGYGEHASETYASGDPNGSEHPFGPAMSHPFANDFPDLSIGEQAMLLTGPFPEDARSYSNTVNSFQFEYPLPNTFDAFGSHGALGFDARTDGQYAVQLWNSGFTPTTNVEWPGSVSIPSPAEPRVIRAPIQLPNPLARSVRRGSTPHRSCSTPARGSNQFSRSPSRPHGAIPFSLPPLTPTTRPGSRGFSSASRTTPTTSRLPLQRPLHNPATPSTHNSATLSRASPSALTRRPSTGPLPSPASRIAAANRMLAVTPSVTPSHGPIRSQTPNRASRRDTASPYPSQSGQATSQPTLRRVSAPSGVSIPATPSPLSVPGSRVYTPHSAPSLSRNSTPAPLPSLTAPASPANLSPVPNLVTATDIISPEGPSLQDADTSHDNDSIDDFAPANTMDPDSGAEGNEGSGDETSGYPSQSPRVPSDSRSLSNPPEPSDIVTNGEGTVHVAQMPGASYTIGAPTTAEYAINLVEENGTIMDARKSHGEPGRIVKGIRSVTGYTNKEQGYMFLMRVVILFVIQTYMPWPNEDNVVVEPAKVYVKKHTDIDLAEVVTPDFIKTLCSGISRIRGEGLNMVLTLVKDYWSLQEGDKATIEYLQHKNRFTYLDHNKEPKEPFSTDLISNVMVALMFRTPKKVGILFLDKMMEDDNPVELARVLRVAAKHGPDGKLQIPTIVDTSPQARRGPSISAIAFACIHIYHALERLKVPAGPRERKGRSKAGEFGAKDLETRWERYVRELTQSPKLGEIRACLLQRLQQEYMMLRPREEGEQPLGSDHMW